MTTVNPPTRLEYGYNPGLPEDTSAAWGARAIVTEAGGVDLVHDRQSTIGPRAKVMALTDVLDDGVNELWVSAASALLAAGVMDPRRAAEFVLARADGVIVKANTLASGGYLYACAYPEVPEHGSIAWARAEVARIKNTHGSTVTSAGFEAMQKVIAQIERPAFAADEPVLVEREGGKVWTGRFLREEVNTDGRPNGIALVDLDADPVTAKKRTEHRVHIGLITLSPIRPTAQDNEDDKVAR